MGKLIVVEGLDGSGKGTQTALLCDALAARGERVRKISFPDYDEPSSALVKMYLGGEFGDDPDDVGPYQASLFYAADRVASFLKHWKGDYLSEKTILADRYTTSNAIYQMSKLPEERWDEYLSWLSDFEYEKLALPRPDLVLYLDVPIEVSQLLLLERYRGDAGKKDIHERDLSFLRRCRKAALYAAQQPGWMTVHCAHDGQMRPPQTIAEEILTLTLGD